MREFRRLLQNNDYESVVTNLLKSSPKVFVLKCTFCWYFQDVLIKLSKDSRLDDQITLCEKLKINNRDCPKIYEVYNKYGKAYITKGENHDKTV